MKSAVVPGIIALLTWGVGISNTLAWEENEHQLLCDSAYQATMRCYTSPLDDTAFLVGSETINFALPNTLWNRHTFGQMCALEASGDFAPHRFHEPGRTTLEQLRPLTACRIALAWQDVSGIEINAAGSVAVRPTSEAYHLQARNVVCAYLLHHLMALRIAGYQESSDLTEQETLLSALRWEAIAQGYLADAFSSGHLLVPHSGPFARLQKRNNVEAHNYFRNQGVYVMNSRGYVWQTFGDRLLHWHAPTYRAVLEACQYSLREVLVVFYQAGEYEMPEELTSWLDSVAPGISPRELVSSWLGDRDGAEYYATLRMPTLLLIPMPITATWSHRTQDQDEHGIRRHHHYPQLRHQGLHDPGLTGEEAEFLYSRTAVPDWLIPAPYLTAPPVHPDSFIKKDPDWASVRWVQNRYAPPSYKGTLIHFGGQVTFRGREGRAGGLVGLGYGLWDDLILLRNVSFSATILPSVHEPRRVLLVPSFGGGFPLGFGRLKALRSEGGLAIGLRSEFDDIGSMLGIGIDSRVWPLRLTNAGITWRLKYQWFYLDRLLKGPSLELILQ